MLKVAIQRFNTTVILRCTGRVVAGQEAETLEAIALAQRAKTIVVDLSAASEIDARGLGTLAALRRWAKRHGIEFAIRNPSGAVYTLLALTRLDRAIPVIFEHAAAVAC